MLAHLRRIAADPQSKIWCFDMDAASVPTGAIPEPPDICFIDGEHTSAAALTDFQFCLSVCAPNAAICFHDDWVIQYGISDAMRLLQRRGIPFSARKLGGVTFGIFLRACPAAEDPGVAKHLHDVDRWFDTVTRLAMLPRRLQTVLWAVISRLYDA
jgi:hypothetical protein